MLAIQPGDHVGAPFTLPSQFATTTVTVAERALSHQAQMMIFPGDPHRDGLDGFQRGLGRRSPAIAAALTTGQVRVGDSRRVHLAPGRFDREHLEEAYTAATRRALADGYSGLWVSIDMSWARDVAPDALVSFEESASELFTTGQLTAVCHYDTQIFPAGQVTAACAAHPAGLEHEAPLRHRRSPDGRTLRLSGEADLSNAAAFAALTRTLRPGDVLDITEMTFLDVRALATIVRAYRDTAGLSVRAGRTHAGLLDLVGIGRRASSATTS
ncbi:MEDS domain-containing protein [Actinoplanes sp. NPDC023936]|uniref:MEDS domain-containing protein n=1 Tax=Actinoplanes sp. NPDC023936 TaxID=3154910 RepID=UPI003402AC6A